MADVELQTMDSLEEILAECLYGNYEYVLREHNGAPYLQIAFDAPDVDTGEIETQWCRKWTLQFTMTNTEVVRTAVKATREAVLHEFEEGFRYRGARILDPHMDVEWLVDVLDREGQQDTRIAKTVTRKAS